MSDATLRRWESESPAYHQAHLRLRQVASLVSAHGPDAVLDLGCAAGALRDLVAPARYHGCDFVDSSHGRFPFTRCDFNREPLPAELPSVDAVVCSGLLEYIEDVPALLAQARTHLRGDGVLVATYVNMNHVLRITDLVRGRTMCSHPDWRGFWSPRDIAAKIRAAGFDIAATYETTRGVGPEPDVRTTSSSALRLRHATRASGLLAHELIFVARPH